jgi:hypothetical protein
MQVPFRPAPTVFLELPCGRKHNIGGFVETEKYLRHLERNVAAEVRVQDSAISGALSL